MPTHNDFANNIAIPNATSNAMQTYTQQYQYDKLGNIMEMKSNGRWTRNYVYDTATNRLLKHDALQTFDDYSYDEHGNMTSMPHLSSLHWDYNDWLTQ
ncbi:MAG: hypothetical protein N4A74_25415, partial [Carboxylicivirga sp.]|nr:hypothetical protein [Carboxylicivirga sp.]